MFDRLILSAALIAGGYNGLNPPTSPVPVPTLKELAVNKSMSGVCLKKKKQKQSETVKAMCKKWKQQQETS